MKVVFKSREGIIIMFKPNKYDVWMRYCWCWLLNCMWGKRLDSYSIRISLNFMSGGEYSEQLGQASRIQRYLEWGYEYSLSSIIYYLCLMAHNSHHNWQILTEESFYCAWMMKQWSSPDVLLYLLFAWCLELVFDLEKQCEVSIKVLRLTDWGPMQSVDVVFSREVQRKTKVWIENSATSSSMLVFFF